MSLETREKLLDTAEALFARQGFASTSVRQITGTAEVNLAALNYHFGSKDELIREVFHRRLEPLNRRRLELLDQYEQKWAPEGPPLEEILDAFFRPPLEMPGSDQGGESFVPLMGRAFTEPGDFFQRHIAIYFQEVGKRFSRALQDALPELDKEVIFWRFHFIIGALAHTLGHVLGVVQERRPEIGDLFPAQQLDPDRLTRELVAFASAGLRAGGVP